MVNGKQSAQNQMQTGNLQQQESTSSEAARPSYLSTIYKFAYNMYKESVKTKFEVEKELPNIVGQLRVLNQKYIGYVNVKPQIQQFKTQVESLTHFTYRQTFLQPIATAPEIQTDAGWSCMHRTG